MLECQQLLAFNIYKQNKFHAQLSWAWEKFNNLEARFYKPGESVTVTWTCKDRKCQIQNDLDRLYGNFFVKYVEFPKTWLMTPHGNISV